MKIAKTALVIALGLMATSSIAQAAISKTVKTVATTQTTAAPQAQTCQALVKQLKSEWKVVDYGTPSKPAAAKVQGKYGHENSAAQIAYMQGEIKKADADCKAGNQQASLQRVSSIHDMLDSRGINQETANAAMAQQ